MITNNLNLPQPFVDAATSNHKYKPRRFNVTEVLGGTCEAVLKRRHHGEADEGHHMEFRPGEDMKREHYCPVAQF